MGLQLQFLNLTIVGVLLGVTVTSHATQDIPPVEILYDKHGSKKFFIRVGDQKLWGTAESLQPKGMSFKVGNRPPRFVVLLGQVSIKGERIRANAHSVSIDRGTGQVTLSGRNEQIAVRIRKPQGGYTVVRGTSVSYNLLRD